MLNKSLWNSKAHNVLFIKTDEVRAHSNWGDASILFLREHCIYLVERLGERRQDFGEVLPNKAIGVPGN